MKNPFVTGGYVSPKYFCDREKETDNIISLLSNGNNIALISPRRFGKTDLITHCFRQEGINDEYHTFLIDIYATKSLSDFVAVFGSSVIQALRSKGRAAWEMFIGMLTSVRSEISYDMEGKPVWSIGLGNIEHPATTLDEIFRYLNMADKPCLVAIDEFQQISRYSDGENVEAALRTHIQRCSNASFLFSGSQRHLMNNIFLSPSKPFYQSVTTMNLQAIPLEKYKAFCLEKFREGGKEISEETVTEVYEKCNATTMYMQRIMNILYMQTSEGKTCSIEQVQPAIDYLLELSSDTYESLFVQIPEKQRNLLLAIASERKANEVMSGAFVRKHRLPSASSVSVALKGLLEKDFITFDNGYYSIYDLFFQMWIERRFLKLL